MSKAVQGALAILIILLVVCAGVAVFTLIQKSSLEKENQNLQSQITDFQDKESKLLSKAKKLEKDQKDLKDQNENLSQKLHDKDQLQQQYDDLKSKIDDLNNQVIQAGQERDDWKTRVETIRRERDELMEKLKNQPSTDAFRKERDELEAQIKELQAGKNGAFEDGSSTGVSDSSASLVTSSQGDQYWAQVLKEKAALQLDLEKAKADLDQSALQVVELRKQNADMQMELKNLTDAKDDVENKMKQAQDEYERKLKYNEDLSNSLSMEVARARSDQKMSTDRVEKIKQEYQGIQAQIKQLTTTKIALERTIAQINQDKVVMGKKLSETEGVIQGRINEIWQIKQNLDQKILDLPVKSGNGEVELPPIIVNANGQPPEAKSQALGAKSQGSVISINEQNNFAIVDLGEFDGSQVGRKINVSRDSQPIGTLEVIQVRKDISAGDIKHMSVKLRVGDTVKF